MNLNLRHDFYKARIWLRREEICQNDKKRKVGRIKKIRKHQNTHPKNKNAALLLLIGWFETLQTKFVWPHRVHFKSMPYYKMNGSEQKLKLTESVLIDFLRSRYQSMLILIQRKSAFPSMLIFSLESNFTYDKIL